MLFTFCGGREVAVVGIFRKLPAFCYLRGVATLFLGFYGSDLLYAEATVPQYTCMYLGTKSLGRIHLQHTRIAESETINVFFSVTFLVKRIGYAINQWQSNN